jgi:hypothetical protein
LEFELQTLNLFTLSVKFLTTTKLLYKNKNIDLILIFALIRRLNRWPAARRWTVEINRWGFVPAGAPTLKYVQVQRRRGKVRE